MIKKKGTTTIQSAGKVLSQKNADALQKAFLAIGTTLASAGLLDLNSIESLEMIVEKAEPSDGEMGDVDDENIAAAKKSLTDEVQAKAWLGNLQSAISGFINRFQEILLSPDSYFSNKYGIDVVRTDVAQNLVSELSTLLQALVTSAPVPMEDPSWGMRNYWSPSDYSYDLSMSAINYSAKKINSALTEQNAIAAPQATEGIALNPVITTEPIAASSEQTEETLEVQFSCMAMQPEDVDINAAANKFPITGVLFRIDEASESQPSVGPSLPLYITQAVAETALNQVNGLPLDAHNSFSQHANENITGVLQSASIVGKDFRVTGHLFPFNKPEVVQAIAQKQHLLGMSMNAKAAGHKATIDGKEVFQVDRLELLGANILYADKATYQKTKVEAIPVAASQSTEPIAASSATETTTKTDDMDETLIKAQFEELKNLVVQAQSANQQAQDKHNNEISELRTIVSEIQKERNERQQEVLAQASAQQKEQERQAIAEGIRNLVKEELKEGFKTLRNPSGQPTRITPIIAQGVAVDAPQRSPIEQQLIIAQSQLDALRAGGGSTQARIAKQEEISQLRAQLLSHA